MIRLLLVDDQTLLRQGLASLLSLEDDIEVVGQASHGREAITLAQQLQPDVILMDVRMPICDGVMATREIRQLYPGVQILILTTFDEDEYIWQSLQAGAMGYLLKSTPSQQMAAAIRSVYHGNSLLSPTVASKVFAQLVPPIFAKKDDSRNLLSSRELEVLKLLGQGKSNREIAQTLYLSEGTVKNYISRILCELEVRDRTQAALWAQQHLS